MTQLELSLALTRNDFSRAIMDGSIRPQGVEFIATGLHPSEMYWRQLRFGDFDVSEMSLASLFIGRSRGNRDWTALPVFTMRRYFHTHILVRDGAGIRQPADLRGKRVGVPEYQQTAAVWSRGVLQHEFGVHARDIDWLMERAADKSHGGATGFTPPPEIRLTRIAPGSSIGEMLLDGSLDATLLFINSTNLVDRSKRDIRGEKSIRPLFEDAAAEGRRYHASTGLYPINHVLVIRTSLLEQHPWLALNLYTAFVAAREEALRAARAALVPLVDTGRLGAEAVAAMGIDPAPYGIKAARRELEVIAQYLHEQGLTDRTLDLGDIFAASTLDV